MKKLIWFLVIVLIILGIYYYWHNNIRTQNINLQNSGLGERCGGNMSNAPVCAKGYHCAPNPHSTLPFGDVGGTCAAN